MGGGVFSRNWSLQGVRGRRKKFPLNITKPGSPRGFHVICGDSGLTQIFLPVKAKPHFFSISFSWLPVAFSGYNKHILAQRTIISHGGGLEGRRRGNSTTNPKYSSPSQMETEEEEVTM